MPKALTQCSRPRGFGRENEWTRSDKFRRSWSIGSIVSSLVCPRPLFHVWSDQEWIYQASRIVEGVALRLLDFAQSDTDLDRFDAAEVAGRLEFVVESMRPV